jgi:subtilisin family serine protease
MASPVVAGVAALILQYYPQFTPQQVKMIIEQSAVPFTSAIRMPGSGDEILLSELSRTGGLVNAYEAVRMADELARTGKIKTENKKIKVDGKEIKIKTETPSGKKKVKSA